MPRSGWKILLLFPALFVAGLWGLYLGGVYLLLLAIFLLLLSLRDFLFPIKYQITPEGVTMKGVLLKRATSWAEVEEIAREEGLIKLRLRKGSSSHFARWFVVHLTDKEEEIWRKIEIWRRNS